MYPLLEEYERRDVKQREYCKEKGIRMATFGYWLRKFRKERSKTVTGTTNNGFKEIRVKEQYSEPMIEIKYLSRRCCTNTPGRSGSIRTYPNIGFLAMLGIPSTTRYYVYSQPTDMRKSFDGLGGLVRDKIGKDLLSGDAFIFINKRRTLLKILVWDRTGFVIYYKRLEKGTFELPTSTAAHVEIEWAQLVMILEGVRLKSIRRNLRYAV